MPLTISRLAIGFVCLLAVTSLAAQDKSVKPGVNDSFRDPDVKQFEGRFEVESREVYALRKEIVAACQIQAGQTVADIGAGTGLFTRMFSDGVGQDGRVLAVDISQKFLDHTQKTTREAGQQNVETLLGSDDSTKLPPNTIDVAFICDTYHHFEFPLKTMTSLFQAMKPGGRVILVDFKRIEGESSDWTLNHVRAGQEVFEAEVLSTGFKKAREEKELLKENYFVVFEKPLTSSPTAGKFAFPIIAAHGGVVSRPTAVDQPRAGAKVVFDVTVDAKPSEVNKGLDRAARLLNLYGASGLQAKDVSITVVLHGEATKSALNDAAYKARFETEQNPNLPLIRELQTAGVEVLVCGQALNYKNFANEDVATEVKIAAAAMIVVINRQLDGNAYLPLH
ncbi:MAG: methyltransferase domain-containing protein [Planctomycetota bacterium]|nr:MAG: methyltransferase domain-containing protein [Planctomycetota bacterium]